MKIVKLQDRDLNPFHITEITKIKRDYKESTVFERGVAITSTSITDNCFFLVKLLGSEPLVYRNPDIELLKKEREEVEAEINKGLKF
jgi:hypothetical protein